MTHLDPTTFNNNPTNTDHPAQRIIQNFEVDNEEDTDPYATDSGSSYTPDVEENSSDELEDGDVTGNLKRSRKRKRNEFNWLGNKRKVARANGTEYVTKKGVVVSAKSLKPPCSCRRKCFEKFSEEERLYLFQDFYKLDYNSVSVVPYTGV